MQIKSQVYTCKSYKNVIKNYANQKKRIIYLINLIKLNFRKIFFFSNIIKMGGGLMQLVAYGAQDVYLTGNPQITFWKVTYRRYTNFAMESIEQTFNGQADFGRRVTCTISRNGDLSLPHLPSGYSS